MVCKQPCGITAGLMLRWVKTHSTFTSSHGDEIGYDIRLTVLMPEVQQL